MPPPGPSLIGPEVDTTPRPLPARIPIRGRYVTLEPLHRRHAAELWQAAQGADDSWTYLGNIWFSPRMQRTRAATEAIFLTLKLAADDLGYRRLVWKCNALNAPSKRAAERLGFIYEGRHRMHMLVKGRQRSCAG
jgi:RimJ/RimL family protein N-acetyltransferase